MSRATFAREGLRYEGLSRLYTRNQSARLLCHALLRFARPNDQLALRTERVIAAKLQFVQSYRLEGEA